MKKIITQILKNQAHILHILGSMHESGNVSTDIYCRDEGGIELMKETDKLLKNIAEE